MNKEEFMSMADSLRKEIGRWQLVIGERKMDVDLQKSPLIPYNTTQAGIGGNF